MAEWVLLTASNVAYKVFCLIHLWFCFRSSFSKMSTECQGDMRGLKKNTFIRSMNTFRKVTGAASHHTQNHSVVKVSTIYRQHTLFMSLTSLKSASGSSCTWRYAMSSSCSRSKVHTVTQLRKFTSESWVAPRRSRRHRDQQLQQQQQRQQHDARLPAAFAL